MHNAAASDYEPLFSIAAPLTCSSPSLIFPSTGTGMIMQMPPFSYLITSVCSTDTVMLLHMIIVTTVALSVIASVVILQSAK